MDLIHDAWRLLHSLSGWTFIAMFGMVLLTDAPRYFVGIQATAAALMLRDHRAYGPLPPLPSVSILLAGHNEEDAIEKCVRSLREQTFNAFEIVCVDDGSSDRTFAIMRRLQSEGLVQSIARLQLRGGKAAALNLAARMAHGEIFIVTDCDCSFEPDAIEELLRPLAEDASVGAVSGNILVRNWRRSVTTAIQAIEYLISISLGKTFSGALDQISCISGAFGAFRRSAWHAQGGMDTGGEDFDFTIRLRLAGYKIVFARHSICYTDAPETPFALLRQRSRWERDAYWIRFRKYRRLFNPFAESFLWREAAHQWDFLLFTALPSLAFPFYLAWLFAAFGFAGAITLLATVSIALMTLDVACFLAATLVTGRPVYLSLLPFVPIYGLFQAYVMKLHRFYAYASEAIASLSLTDNYVPQKVRDLNDWR
jgi:cellulose synthase/poly-beta-1,6-N-acetylglucosamine synthase-like glycosyltransferase